MGHPALSALSLPGSELRKLWRPFVNDVEWRLTGDASGLIDALDRVAAIVGELDDSDRVECRVMPTRRCPGSGCGDGPCARFEVGHG